MEEINYKIETFEGPLDLLLNLIEKNKMDIFDVKISVLAEQFLEYTSHMQQSDMDVESEFIVMVATLLEIKSKMLLPLIKDENGKEIDPREELIRKLLEYKKYKDLGTNLLTYEENAPEYMLKPPTIPAEVKSFIPAIDYNELLKGIDINRLNEVFTDVLRRKRDSVDTLRANFGVLEKEKIPLKDTIISIVNYTNLNKKFKFRDLLENQPSRTLVIVTFLGVLELIKVGRIRVIQESNFSEINIEVIEGATQSVDFENLEDA